MDHFYVLIMAGGGGTRLWPLSRKTRPKQMLPLVEDRTMFQATVERVVEKLLPPERIFVVTGRDYVDELRQSTPEVPAENFIVEPHGRNSGPAAALGTIHIQHRDPEAIIAVLTADHHIADSDKFRRVLNACGEMAAQGYLATLGISPSFPSTGFGYIKRGESLKKIGEFQAYYSAGFTEKPDQKTATEFLMTGLYSWNSGMFVWQAGQVLQEFQRQRPDMYTVIMRIAQAIGRPDYDAELDRLWPELKKLSIDYAVMEGAENMAVIPVDIGWSDVGSWATLFEVLSGDLNGNVSRGKDQEHVKIDTRETLIVSDRMVVTIGIEDIVIVDTADVLLVCHRDRSQDVRQVVAQLTEAGDLAHL
ncbi:MAG TPA: mannose-1-phosphate guanylyltransferase [Aggregatilineaceae bacterium]|nr:mannose-1-phosphate guanylyltransferase [Aggregatilineaceae bacterium]